MILFRRVTPLLFQRLRGLYLLIPAVFAALAPFWLDRTAPDLIWAADRALYLRLLIVQQGCLVLFLLLNLMPRHLHLPRSARTWLRHQKTAFVGFLTPLFKNLRLRPAARRVNPTFFPSTRWWHRLPLLVLLIAVSLQSAVLFLNHGYMPLTRDYLKAFSNPAIIAGIENGALLTKRLVDDQTVLPQLAQSIRLPFVERLFPNAFPYYNPVQLFGAAGVFLLLVSQFVDWVPGTRSTLHQHTRPDPDTSAVKIIRIPADAPEESGNEQPENIL